MRARSSSSSASAALPSLSHARRANASWPNTNRPGLLLLLLLLWSQLTADLFTRICHKSEPKDIYLAATVGGCSGGGGGSSFGRAFQDMGVPVLVCSSYRLHSAVSCSLGCAAAGGGSEDKCENAKMREVVRRAVSMVEVFEHWRPEGGVFAAAAAAAPGSGSGSATTLETVRVEVEELAAALARARGSNTRRVVVGCAGVSAVCVCGRGGVEAVLGVGSMWRRPGLAFAAYLRDGGTEPSLLAAHIQQ